MWVLLCLRSMIEFGARRLKCPRLSSECWKLSPLDCLLGYISSIGLRNMIFNMSNFETTRELIGSFTLG